VTGGTGFNVGNNEGSADFGLNLNNLTGRADRLKWNLSRSSQGNAIYDLSYNLPLFGDVYSPLSLGVAKVGTRGGKTRAETPCDPTWGLSDAPTPPPSSPPSPFRNGESCLQAAVKWRRTASLQSWASCPCSPSTSSATYSPGETSRICKMM
jgi:hypothetical protein